MSAESIRRFLLIFILLSGGATQAQEEEDGRSIDALGKLAEMSLEDLASIEVSSVSKRVEKRTSAPAAVYVLTQEDIRRSPAVTLPDLLREVPGIHVASLDTSTRSVSSRGFGGRYANSLLVLIDGRSIYSPLFSGVEWEIHDLMLEDIERIEVIRGPGGTLWGANAVNGVINVITKNAADTQGGLLTLGAGTEYQGIGAVRYGGAVGEDGAYRLHLRYLGRDDGGSYNGHRSDDDADNFRGGVRFDWDWGDSTFTLLGGFYAAQPSQVFEPPSLVLPFTRTERAETYFSGGSILGRWTRTFEQGGNLRVQAYYDRAEFNNFLLDEERSTLDLDVQYHLPAMGRHEITIGGGVRYFDASTDGSPWVRIQPSSNSRNLFSAFVQDRITVIEDKLSLTLGTKIEHNDFTGLEIQPSARIAWTPNHNNTVWASVSRAVRTPSLADDSAVAVGYAVPGFIIGSRGNEDFESETVVAYEAGYRVRPHEKLQLDLALFYNEYKKLRGPEFGRPFVSFEAPFPHVAVPTYPQNNTSGSTYGAELSIDWAPRSWWRLRFNYALLEMDIDLDHNRILALPPVIDESSPQQQAFVGSYMELGEHFELDFMLRYVDQLPALGIDDYVTADVRFSWRPSDDLEVSLVGHDLLDAGRVEYDSMFVNTVPTEVQRGVYGKITWRF